MRRNKGATAVPFPFETKTITVGETDYTFKELTVGENDACADAAKGEDGAIDGRKMMRLMVTKSSVEPKLTLDDLAECPNRLYIKFCEVVNVLNIPEDEGEDPNA
jgi:hypothetical protein